MRDGQKMYTAAKQMETEQRSRLGKIQSQLQALHVKQKQLAEVITFRPSALSVTAFGAFVRA